MRRIYDRELVARSLTGLAATLSIVVVVFLAEQLTTLVETLVENRMSLGELPWVLALTAPEIVVTAAPLAVLIGVYRALIDARDASETVALAGAGVGPGGLVGGLLGLGAVLAVAVVLVAGFLDPVSRAVRDKLFLEARRELVVAAIRDGLEPDRFRSLDGYTFVSPGLSDASRHRLLIFLPREGDRERIVATDHYDLAREGDGNRYRLRLKDVVVSDVGLVAPSAVAAGTATPDRGSSFRLGSLTRDVDLDELLRDPRLVDRAEYRALPELLGAAGAAEGPRREFRTRATEILARSTLSLAAVFVATIAVSFAAGNLRFVTLPAAGAVLVTLDLGLVRVARSLQDLPSSAYFAIVAASVIVLLAGLAIAAAVRYPGVVAPRRGRA